MTTATTLNTNIFSQAQIDTLKFIGVNLDTQHTSEDIANAYEKHLRETRKQSMHVTAYVTSQSAAIYFASVGLHIPSALGFAASGIFGFIYYTNKGYIERTISKVKYVSEMYEITMKASKRDSMAIAIDAHARNILEELEKQIWNTTEKNYNQNYEASKLLK